MHEWILARRLPVLFPSDERPEQHAAERDHEQRDRQAERLNGRVLRLYPAPRARLEHTEHHDTETARRQRGSHTVEPRLGPTARRVRDEACRQENETDEQDLAGKHNAPRELRRGPTSDDRPDGDASPGDTADHGIGGLAGGSLEVARDQSRHRGKHERGPEPFEEGPPKGEDGNGRSHRRHRRSAAVDDKADNEGATTADDVADLAARQHEHRHDQAVQGDDGLDDGHGRVEVSDQLADRHVHDRLVQHHQELCRRQ